jgi:hypothetical protein
MLVQCHLNKPMPFRLYRNMVEKYFWVNMKVETILLLMTLVSCVDHFIFLSSESCELNSFSELKNTLMGPEIYVCVTGRNEMFCFGCCHYVL